MKERLVIGLLILLGLTLKAQDRLLRVLDAETNEPVPFASLQLETGQGQVRRITGHDGTLVVPVGRYKSLTFQCLGYESITLSSGVDTLTQLRVRPKGYPIDALVVTGQMKPRPTERAVHHVSVLSKAVMEQKTATNLTGLLGNELTINLTNEGPVGRSFTLRGMSGEQVKIMVDGIPITGRQRGVIDLDQLNLVNVSHVEITDGPMSVIYGSNALGGTVNIITAKPSDSRPSAMIDGYYESVGVYNAKALITGGKGKHNVVLYGVRNFFSGYNPVAGSRYKLWKPKRQYIPGFSYNYRDKRLFLAGGIEYFHEELRNRDSLSAKYLYEAADDIYYYTFRLNSHATGSLKLSERSTLTLTSGYSYYRKDKNTYHNNLVKLEKYLVQSYEMQDTTLFHQFSQRLGINRLTKKAELLAGIDINQEYGSGKRIAGLNSIGDYALYWTGIFTPFKGLQLQPGLRYGLHTRYRSPLVYSVSVSNQTRHATLRASYGKGYRTPSLKELYMEFIDQNHHVLGNADLRPETGHNLIASALWKFSLAKGAETGLTLFQNRIIDKIDFVFDTVNPTYARYHNFGNGRFLSQGADLSLAIQATGSLYVKAGAIITGLSSIYNPNDLNYSPDFLFSVTYRNRQYPFRLHSYYKFTGRKVYYKGTLNNVGNFDNIAEEYIASFNNIDLTAALDLAGGKVTLSVGAKNLLNYVSVISTRTHYHGGGDGFALVGWGRTFFIKMNMKFR